MRRLTGTLLGLLVAVSACSDQLVVENLGAPDAERALRSPDDVETLVLSTARTIHQATIGATGDLTPQLLVMGMESYSGNANWGMGARGGIPRATIDNNRGNQTAGENFGPFLSLHQAARAAAVGLSRLNDPTFTFLTPDPARVAAARAVGYFARGQALGYVAMTYDSGAPIGNDDDLSGPPLPFVGYQTLMAYALASLDTALAIATGAPAPASITVFPGNTLTGAQFARVIRSYQARFRAGVARDPAERAAVNWGQVQADAAAGVTTDFNLALSTASGGWGYRPAQMDLYQSWHQAWQFMVGMADTSGGYQAWLGTPVASRTAFLVITPDNRLPDGLDRAAQNASSGCVSGSTCTPPGGTARYWRNRLSGQDVLGAELATSFYDFHRFQAFFSANRNGNIPVITRAEMDLLQAEAYIRTGSPALAVPLINTTRVAAGLPAVTGAGPVPGGAACVPRIPTGGAGTACGDLLEAMKWEKRMETAFTHWGAWYFDGRGWGDLPANTPTQYPVPYQELDARLIPIYTYGTGAAAGTYGL